MVSQPEYLDDPIKQGYESARALTIIFACLVVVALYAAYNKGFSSLGISAFIAGVVITAMAVNSFSKAVRLRRAYRNTK